ncbi:uncharacterized protein PHACADRAFT_261888 [Phanerochaete carnosa HHB-10118-sp]|uniref:tRNA (adenine(58)-N(1))-methyltransferase catalytic subunit TRM61 n=1 Tax=Phanerochaete carnosa (strain HHB-10118-sp) TaxID=650164 RepID=K5UPD5_PHACS|nr:uncharacterized protein PHACADRAFT_261888 [Phanerochaete carnosa HHB-10118-sp]EKM51636.1 hypothetical protein PHACADRAFT_261888 [Phanerochaete carnosa HHB-10118-sp]
MWSTAREIADGDLVIVWLTRDLVQPLVVCAGKELNSRFGVYRHADLVGVPYGSKVGSRNGKGFVHVLRPTPELWTLALPHRTQILYLADIAFVTSWLDIRPGSRVIEAGTGSGSFSHSTARTIGPTGHLWSYEFHEARANKAREEFTRHGMDKVVTLTHRNVCKDGFTVEDMVDAVFLDLPAPWEAIQHAKKALRKERTTRICCFSPCMEQVLRTVSALNEAGFTEITMYETLLRPQQVDAPPAPPSVADVAAQLKRAEARREEKRLGQIAHAHRQRAAKRKHEDVEAAAAGDGDGDGDETGGKRARTEEGEDSAATDTPAPAAVLVVGSEEATEAVEERKISVSKAFPEVRGHTSYLTFAVLLPPAAYAGVQEAKEAEGVPTEAEGLQASGVATPEIAEATTPQAAPCA